MLGGGGGGGGGDGGLGDEPGAAEDDPHALSEVPIPIAAIVRNIAELPTALPTAVRNSRRFMSFASDAMPPPVLSALYFLPKISYQSAD